MGSNQSTSSGGWLNSIKTAFGCPNWFDWKNWESCFKDMSYINQAIFAFIILYAIGVVAVLTIILGDLLIGGEGFIEDIGSIFGDVFGIFEWLSSFLESAFSYVAAGTAYVVAEAMQLAGYLGQATGTPALLWVFIAGMGLLWVALKVIKDVLGQSASFKNSAAYPFFYVFNTPIRWIVDGLDVVLGSWAATIAQVFAFPINCVILLLSELLGLILTVIEGFF